MYKFLNKINIQYLVIVSLSYINFQCLMSYMGLLYKVYVYVCKQVEHFNKN